MCNVLSVLAVINLLLDLILDRVQSHVISLLHAINYFLYQILFVRYETALLFILCFCSK